MKYFDEDRFEIDDPATFEGKMFDEDRFEVSFTKSEEIKPVEQVKPVDPNYEMTAFDELDAYWDELGDLVPESVKQHVRNILPRAAFAAETGGSPLEIAGSSVGDLATAGGRATRSLIKQEGVDTMSDLKPTSDNFITRGLEHVALSPSTIPIIASGGVAVPTLAAIGAAGGLIDEAYKTKDSDIADYAISSGIGGLAAPIFQMTAKGLVGAAKGITKSAKETLFPKSIAETFGQSKIPVPAKGFERLRAGYKPSKEGKFYKGLSDGYGDIIDYVSKPLDGINNLTKKTVKASKEIMPDKVSDAYKSFLDVVPNPYNQYQRSGNILSNSFAEQFGFGEKIDAAKETYKDMITLKDLISPISGSHIDNLNQSGYEKQRGSK